MSKQSETGFLGRWSERKRAAADESAQSVETAHEPPTSPEEDTRPDDEILAEAGLKAPEELKEGDDFTAYLKSALPERIKKRAMRQLWRSNPVLANLDGLCDYDDDFTDAAMVVPNMKTLYQVGKGMLRDVLEPDEDPTTEGDEDEIDVADEDTVHEEMPESAPPPPENPDESGAEMVAGTPNRARHMRFRPLNRI